MSVGTGSIRRAAAKAAKPKTADTGEKPKETEPKAAGTAVQPRAEEPGAEDTGKKPKAAGKPRAKKTAKAQAEDGMVFCHLTEELPVYLL